MLLPSDQRHLLGAFLRRRREALAPDAAGLARFQGRRRTPGLRREEVADLCGLSTTWYTWVEQGRDVALSAEALARLAKALRLSPAERAYLFALTRRRDPASASQGTDDQVPPVLPDVLNAISTPAYLLDRLWFVQARNAAAEHLFAPWFTSGEPCLLRYVFLHASARRFICDWEDRAKRILGEFRADTARNPGDPACDALTQELARASRFFRDCWADLTVLSRDGGARAFDHPTDGLLHFEQTTLAPATRPDLKLVVLCPRLG